MVRMCIPEDFVFTTAGVHVGAGQSRSSAFCCTGDSAAAAHGTRGSDAAVELGSITASELSEIRKMQHPPLVVRRTLEATCILLRAGNTSKDVCLADSTGLAPPPWPAIQRTLAAHGFVQQVLEYNIDGLRANPDLVDFVATQYLGAAGGNVSAEAWLQTGTLCRRAGQACHEPLTYQKVLHASRAAATLLNWCVSTLVRIGVQLPTQNVAECRPAPSQDEIMLEDLDEVDLDAAALLLEDTEETPTAARTTDVVPQLALTAGTFWRRPANNAHGTTADRHFEEILTFPCGERAIAEEQEAELHRVVTAMELRPTLRLRLIGCVSEVEDSETVRERLSAVESFLSSRGIPCSSTPDAGGGDASARWSLGTRQPGSQSCIH